VLQEKQIPASANDAKKSVRGNIRRGVLERDDLNELGGHTRARNIHGRNMDPPDGLDSWRVRGRYHNLKGASRKECHGK
jgi:hypothetical protein